MADSQPPGENTAPESGPPNRKNIMDQEKFIKHMTKKIDVLAAASDAKSGASDSLSLAEPGASAATWPQSVFNMDNFIDDGIVKSKNMHSGLQNIDDWVKFSTPYLNQGTKTVAFPSPSDMDLNLQQDSFKGEIYRDSSEDGAKKPPCVENRGEDVGYENDFRCQPASGFGSAAKVINISDNDESPRKFKLERGDNPQMSYLPENPIPFNPQYKGNPLYNRGVPVRNIREFMSPSVNVQMKSEDVKEFDPLAMMKK